MNRNILLQRKIEKKGVRKYLKLTKTLEQKNWQNLSGSSCKL